MYTGEMMKHRQFLLNSIATILNLLIQLAISFFLTSYLVKTIGATAYGFYGMANTMVNYALIVTNALNSMAARFVGYELHNKNIVKAQNFYSSVFWGDVLFSLVIFIPSIIFIYNLEQVINIPTDIVNEVKLLFFLVFINMCCNVVCAVFGCVYTIKNKLDVQAYLNVGSNLLKASLLVFLYVRYEPSIVFLGIATLSATIVLSLGNMHYSHKFLRELKLSVANVKFSSLKQIVSSGVWNSINQLSVTLLHGLDLVLANLMVCAEAMGVLSLAGTIPGVIAMCVNTLANLFTPNLLLYYSKERFDLLLHEIRNSIKFMTLISCLPISFLISFGVPFFKLWTPNTDIQMLYILSIFVMFPQFTGGAITSMNYLYTVANKVKWQSMVLLGSGILNFILVYILLKYTNLGVYAVVSVSAVIGFVRNFCFNAPFAAHCIKQKFYVFWPDMLKSFVVLICCSVLGLVVNSLFDITSWSRLIVVGGLYSIVITILISLVVLSKEQRLYIKSKLIR